MPEDSTVDLDRSVDWAVVSEDGIVCIEDEATAVVETAVGVESEVIIAPELWLMTGLEDNCPEEAAVDTGPVEALPRDIDDKYVLLEDMPVSPLGVKVSDELVVDSLRL